MPSKLIESALLTRYMATITDDAHLDRIVEDRDTIVHDCGGDFSSLDSLIDGIYVGLSAAEAGLNIYRTDPADLPDQVYYFFVGKSEADIQAHLESLNPTKGA